MRTQLWLTAVFAAATGWLGAGAVALANVEVVMQKVEYRDGDVELEGVLAFDRAAEGKLPGVLVVPEWWGLNDFAKEQARRLAEQGYAALAVDMYGKGKVTEDATQAGQWASELRGDPERLRRRAMAGLETLKKQKMVDDKRVGAIGFCFGGTTVMQMAYGGADLNAVVSLHGGLEAPTAEEVKRIKPAVLVLHGSEDQAAPLEKVAALMRALRGGNIDWQVTVYGGAEHAFTNPQADRPGAKYHERSAQRAMGQVWRFLADALGARPPQKGPETQEAQQEHGERLYMA